MKRYVRKLNLLDTWTAVLTDPFGTMEHLLCERDYPPYLLISSVGIMLTVFFPGIIYQYEYDIGPTQPDVTYSFILTLLITFVGFVLTMAIFLRLLGATAPMIKVFAAAVYSLVPVIPVMVTYYVANYFTIGKLTIVTYLMHSRRVDGDWFLNLFPYFLMFALFACFMVLLNALRALGTMTWLTGFLASCVTVALVVLSFIFATVIAGAVFPDTPVVTWNYFRSLPDVPEEK